MEIGYQRLLVWQNAVDLAVEVNALVRKLPNFERFELASQMRRAAVSIPSNIAEGYRRKRGSDDFAQFMRIALGSASELETQLIICIRSDYINKMDIQKAEDLLGHVQRLLCCILR
jgi:four helix bundle protein